MLPWTDDAGNVKEKDIRFIGYAIISNLMYDKDSQKMLWIA